MKTKRNTENGKYYIICNPTTKNKETGNFCVSASQLLKFDKDFLFEYDGEKKVLTKEYVRDHLTMHPFTRVIEKDDLSTKKWFGVCYFITYQDILNAA